MMLLLCLTQFLKVVALFDLFYIFSSWSIKLWDASLMIPEFRGTKIFLNSNFSKKRSVNRIRTSGRKDSSLGVDGALESTAP